jgi:hypothetical protein
MRTARARAGYSRFTSLLVLLSLAAAGVARCTRMGNSRRSVIVLRIEDGARRIRPDDLHRDRCERSVLGCADAIGRATTLLCRCVDRWSAGDRVGFLPLQADGR